MSIYSSGKYGSGKYGGIGVIPTTYSECLTRIRNESSRAIKLYLIGLLPSLRQGNPLYSEGLTTINVEEDPVIKVLLTAEIYQFLVELTPEETALFDYCEPGYIDKNPGIVGNSFASYVGVYINQQGEYSGIYP